MQDICIFFYKVALLLFLSLRIGILLPPQNRHNKSHTLYMCVSVCERSILLCNKVIWLTHLVLVSESMESYLDSNYL